MKRMFTLHSTAATHTAADGVMVQSNPTTSKAVEEDSYDSLRPLVEATAHLSRISASQLAPQLPEEAVHALIRAGYKVKYNSIVSTRVCSRSR